MSANEKGEMIARNAADAVGPSRRDLLRLGAGAVLGLSGALHSAASAASLDISNRLSPKNLRRPRRPETRYIVLHTTEGGEVGSLKKIQRRGEAHYFVSLGGKVYRIIDKSRIATHAGRSMWEGRHTIDNYAIGIEVVGYHNRMPTDQQFHALMELLRQLKSYYRIADAEVVTHSMVAYGRPNRFHRNNHRGRKRCAMIFARPDVRLRLGLSKKPERDRDVEAGRLRVGDWELQRFLYARATLLQPAGDQPTPTESNLITKQQTAWYIARERYNSPSTTYVFPDGSRRLGDQIEDWGRIPVGTRVYLEAAAQGDSEEDTRFEGFLEIGRDGGTPQEIAGEAYDDATTIYFLPSGMVRTGQELSRRRSTRPILAKPPIGTRLLVGYVYGGHLRDSRLPARVAGVKWNYPSTFYRFPDGQILSGDEINASAIPRNTLIFYQN